MRLKSAPELFRISARQSDLAKLQAYRVAEALSKAHAGAKVQFNFRASLGDQNQNDPLWKMPEKGVFTEDFLRDLIEGSAELVVHSWKDLPTEQRPHTRIAATLPRADVRDVLLFRKDRIGSGKVRVLTSSPRRAYNLAPFLKTALPFKVGAITFENVRGNIPTRLKKLLSQDVECLIVAKAALDRLLASPEPEFEETRQTIRQVLSQTRFMVLPLSVNPTAAAQGALAVEIRRDRDDVAEALEAIHDAQTFETVEQERRILAGYGGGCHQKIGVTCLQRDFGRLTFLRGLTDAGEVLNEVRLDAKTAAQPRATSEQAVFPQTGVDSNFFDRDAISRDEWAWAEKERHLWVARETAWPENFKPHPEAIVWTAGLRTWEKLAARGVWVSGTAESLGEDESTRIEEIAGEQRWVKLTHADSPNTDAKLCATYRLKAKPKSPSLVGKTHFYWMSGSSFDRAVQLHPEIVKGHHACGPGHTHKHLRTALGETVPIAIHLSVDDWRRAVLPSSR